VANAISIRGAVKRYGPITAVDGLDLEVPEGTCVGLLGPNGAGKSTTMRILSCFMPASGGTARVAGYDVFSQSMEVRRRIGYLPENVPLYTDLRVAAYLDFVAEIKGGPNNVTIAGSYDHDDLPRLMAEIDWVVVPSRWWENSPLVIQEAFLHGKPVICSDIGGMAEKVSDGVNGLHFRVGNATSLAATLERAILTPGLWEDLHGRLPAVYGMDDHISSLAALYADLREGSAARAGHLTL